MESELCDRSQKAGVKKNGLAVLANATHATKKIAADHNQKSFKYTLEKFMRVRISAAIISQGRKKKASNAAFFALFEKEYGVPAGVIVAILGAETRFG
jgi:membrane-bound lytic murein transglycosylase B